MPKRKKSEATKFDSRRREAGDGAPDAASKRGDALTVSKEALSALVESAPVAIVIIDRDGHIVFVNAQTEQVFGYGREELIGQPVEILIPEALRAAHAGHRTEYFADPHTRLMGAGLQLTGRRKDGSEFPMDCGLTLVALAGETYTAAFIADMTEQKQAEQALRLRNAAVAAAANGIVVADRDGNIVWVNAAFTALTGYPFEEAVGQNLRLLKSGKQDQPFY